LQSTIALVVFASAYALIRIALSELPPLTVAALRFLLASSLMLPLALVRYRHESPKLAKSEYSLLFVLAAMQIFFPNFLQNIGLEYTTASVTSVLQSTAPVFTLLLSYALLREGIGWQEVTGVVVGMAGVLLLSTGGNLGRLAGSVFVADLLQVGVAASYAASGILGKVILQKHEPMYVVTLLFVIGAGMLSVFAVTFERNAWPRSISSQVIIALLLLSFLYCLALLSWYDVLQRTGVFQLYVLLFTMPVLAVIISVIVLSESFTVLDIVFSAITLLGVAVTQLRRSR
jgi:drug/metabolite transporter (DMT)-like permease